jgi:pimeloyl-ACP methyl ester carboxylesterase
VTADPSPFVVSGPAGELHGQTEGEAGAPPIALLHGLTATRRYVVHGSRALPRRGYRTIAYDARGHGESDPGRPGGYGYAELSGDLAAVLAEQSVDRRCVLAGHSMGAHTLAAHALADPDRVAGMVVIGPSFVAAPLTDEQLEYWDALADGLERNGVEGFIAAYDRGLDPAWRQTLLRITRDRLGLHRHPEAVAQALREVPRSSPFDDLAELEFLDLPALVIASHDDSDPGHPYAVAEAWAERLSQATLISEDSGSSPLAWQGGRLSREIADFCERREVAARLSA